MKSQLTPADVRTVADRFLLTPSLAGFPERVILASCGGVMGNDECYVRIALTAIGMEPGLVVEMRQLLVDRLRAVLRPNIPGDTDPGYDALVADANSQSDSWVHMVSVVPNPNTGAGEVVVTINDPSFMGLLSTSVIMTHVRGILGPVARLYSRRLIILTGDQRFVPLDFEVDDLFRRSMILVLPSTLRLIRPRLAEIEFDEDPARYAANYLCTVLRLALDRFEFVQAVWVLFSSDGVKIDVNFCGRQCPTAGNLNTVQAVIISAVRQHAFLDNGFFRSLVMAATYSHSEPEGDYDEGLGIAGEYAEY